MTPLAALAAALAWAVAPPAKLGVLVLAPSSDATVAALLATCPPIAKWRLPSATAATEITAFKAACPGSRVAVQLATPHAESVQPGANGATAADTYWLIEGSEQVAPLPTTRIDYLEAPELQTSPSWYSDAGAALFAGDFFARLAQLFPGGPLPVVGAVATGEPQPVTIDGAETNALCIVTDAMNIAFSNASNRWGWSYQAYSTLQTMVVSSEAGLFRYRTLESACQLQGIPIVLTGGSEAGWTVLSADAEVCWLGWLDAQLETATDADVVGIALDAAGAGTRSLAPIATPLAAFLAAGTLPGICSAGYDGGSGGGSGGTGNAAPGGTYAPVPRGCGCGTGGGGVALAAGLALLALRRRRQGLNRYPMPRIVSK